MSWDVIVIGGINTDYLIRGPQLPAPGETIQGETFHIAPGGKGANQAVAAARLGARATLIACIGADERGDTLLEGLIAEGVDTQFIRRDNTAITGAALVQVALGGQKQILAAPGANEQLTVADILAVTEVIANTPVLLAQLEAPIPTVTAAFRLARQAEALVILDAGRPVSLPDETISLIDVLRANASEAEALTGISVKDRRTARQAVDALIERGAKAAVVQAGDEGNLMAWPQGEQWLPLLDVATVDTTGAGDAFAGALAVYLAEGRPLPDAAAFANAAAALATTKVGAQEALPRREDVAALLTKTGSS